MPNSRFDGQKKFKVYEKGGTLRVSVQDVKNVQHAKAALEGVVGGRHDACQLKRPSNLPHHSADRQGY